MPTSQSLSRRTLLATATMAAAAFAVPVADAAESTSPTTQSDRPRLPLLILDRAGLMEPQARAIGQLSSQISVVHSCDALPDADVIFGGLGETELDRATRLRWIQVTSAGVEGILFPRLIASDIVLTNAQGCYAPQIAEHVFGLLFALTRGIAHQARQRRWDRVDRLVELRKLTMGIIGLGGIGREVARRAKAMDMRVIAVDAEPMYAERFAMVDEVGLVDDALDSLLERSDVLVMAAPLTRRTRGMLGEPQFARMKKGAYLINVSRGKTVQMPALLAALASGHLAGAGLDVTDPEPLPPEHELWRIDNVVITSHIAGQSQLGRERVHNVFVENVRRWISNQPLLNVVDKRKGY